jgi:hypothetical protein
MTTRRKSPKKPESFAAGVGRGLRRAARTAREVARMHGTPIYVWEDGKGCSQEAARFMTGAWRIPDCVSDVTNSD